MTMLMTNSMVMAQIEGDDVDNPTVENTNYSEAEKYRRSSLALILITHKNEQYAREIESQFYQIVPPERYNSHNISVRALSATSKNMSAKKIVKALEQQQVAKQLVSRWFNRDPNTGACNMDLIQERGLYNASKEDNDLAQMTMRKDAMLKDAGEELIQNTFVLVCDLKYHDKQKTSQVFSGLMQVGAAVLGSYAQNTNNAAKAQAFQNFSDLANVSSQAVADIAGFTVNVEAHLLRLEWNKDLSDLMYSSYWVDENTSPDEAIKHKQAYDNDRKSFKLSYIGEYRSQAGRTVSASNSDLNLVVRDVCSNAVDKSVNNLAKLYPVFKPKAPFYCGNDGRIYSYIGTKEGVNAYSKYEVIEPYFNKKGEINYKQKAVLKTRYDDIWKNSKTYITNNADSTRGTAFTYAKGSRDICDQGFLIREMGKVKYQYKKHRFYVDAIVGLSHFSSGNKDDAVEKGNNANILKYKNYYRNVTIDGGDNIYGGFNAGWIWNCHTNVAWDVLGLHFGKGGDFLYTTVSTGFIFRTNPMGKKGRGSIFLWPQVGYGLYKVKMDLKAVYVTSYSHASDTNLYQYYTPIYERLTYKSHFDWNVRLGVNITERLYFALNYGAHRADAGLGFQF